VLAVRSGAGAVRGGVLASRLDLVEDPIWVAGSSRSVAPSSRSQERPAKVAPVGRGDGRWPPIAVAAAADRVRAYKPTRARLFWRWGPALLLAAASGAVVIGAGTVMERALVGAAPLRPGLRERASGQLGKDGCGQLYVVRPGDTIWSVAVRYDQGGDPRPLMDQLEGEIGGGVLQPGEQLIVP
jgi:hypothetical protein